MIRLTKLSSYTLKMHTSVITTSDVRELDRDGSWYSIEAILREV